ncbi:hypothetical protein GQR58_021332 [Nymphon striatum]|nr:hypothetical protein GQR58_021332 [Nymphon striatum]
MYDEECWKITENVVEEAPQLFTYQEEAGTRMFLLVKDAEARGYERVVIVSEDTYVLSAFEAKFLPNMTVYQERETQARSRYVKSFLDQKLDTDLKNQLILMKLNRSFKFFSHDKLINC